MYSKLSSDRACSLSPGECLHLLGDVSADAGLSREEAARRLKDVGPNELSRGEQESMFSKFLGKLKEPMIALLLGSAVVSLLLGQYDDCLSITLAVVIVISVACVQEYKSDQSIAALSKLAPHRARVVRGSRTDEVEAADLVPGDVVVFKTGDRVPADVRVLQAADLAIDESSLTGETEPVHKRADAVTEPSSRSAPPAAPASSAHTALSMGGGGGGVPVAERRSCAFMGTLVSSGRGLGLVIGTGMSTELGGVVSLMDEAEERKSPLQENMDALAHKLSMLSFVAIAVIFILGMFVSHVGVLEMFNIGVSLAVAAIPEGLPIVVTVTLALGVQRMANKKAVVKKLPAVEALGSASVICVDKTGTLTRNEMTVVELFSLVSPPPPASPSTSRGVEAVGPLDVERNAEAKYAALAADPVAAHDQLASMLGTSVGSRVLLVGGGYDGAGGWAEYARPHTMGGPGGGAQELRSPRGGVRVTGAAAPHLALLAETGTVCNDAQLFSSEVGGSPRLVGQPTEGALLVAAGKLGCKDGRAAWSRVGEVPFSSESKWMGVSARPSTSAPDAEPWWFVKGSADAVLDLCSHALAPLGGAGVGGGDSVYASALAGHPSPPFTVAPLTPVHRAFLVASAETMAREGLRVLALARGTTLPSPSRPGNMVVLGLVGLHDPPREGVKATVATLGEGGVRVVMITGDGETTALAIAAHLGIVQEEAVGRRRRGGAAPGPASPTLELGAEHEVDTAAIAGHGVSISGSQVDGMDEAALARAVASVRVFYRTTPRHKMKIVRAFQATGAVVAMTGDGVNDAPALKIADIGVAMGRSGTDVAKEAADIVLTDDNFGVLVGAIEEGKGIFANIRNFVRFQLSTSIAALGLVALCSLLGLPNPLNAMQILWINILMDGPPAQSLGVEPVDPEVMRRPPRRRDEPIITSALLKRVGLASLIIMSGTLWVFIKERREGDPTAISRDTTMTFTTFVMFDMANAISCRSAVRSIFQLSVTSNPFFLLAVGGSILGQLAVVYAPPLQAVFKTEALTAGDWVFIALLASTVLWVDEFIKWMGWAGLGAEQGEAGLEWLAGSSESVPFLSSALSRVLRLIRSLPGGRAALAMVGQDPYHAPREEDEERDAGVEQHNLLAEGAATDRQTDRRLAEGAATAVGGSQVGSRGDLISRKSSTSAKSVESASLAGDDGAANAV